MKKELEAPISAAATLPLTMVMMVVDLPGSAARFQHKSGVSGLREHAQRGRAKSGQGRVVGEKLTREAMARHAPMPLESQVPPIENTVRMILAAPRTAWCANTERGDRARTRRSGAGPTLSS